MTTGSAFLDKITAAKRAAMTLVTAEERRRTHVSAVERAGKARRHSFLGALKPTDRVNIIAEVKRSSPSAGAIYHGADAVGTATRYEEAGAAAISVLTEPDHFKGSMTDLVEVAAAVKAPVLRKDFTVDRHQIYEAAAAGASAILLIVAALSKVELKELRLIAEDELGMDALVEVHSEQELESAIESGATVIGVNNRNLQTLEVTLETSRRLAHFFVAGKVFISESGIKTPEDIESLRDCGYQGFLVGETLMRAGDPAATLRALAKVAVQ